ncbi:MAG: hypothetical protein SFU98_07900 [Leptospiraceae bacterium]|nr:hypothetical protein [Leptospiraceae bacterium]
MKNTLENMDSPALCAGEVPLYSNFSTNQLIIMSFLFYKLIDKIILLKKFFSPYKKITIPLEECEEGFIIY